MYFLYLLSMHMCVCVCVHNGYSKIKCLWQKKSILSCWVSEGRSETWVAFMEGMAFSVIWGLNSICRDIGTILMTTSWEFILNLERFCVVVTRELLMFFQQGKYYVFRSWSGSTPEDKNRKRRSRGKKRDVNSAGWMCRCPRGGSSDTRTATTAFDNWANPRDESE